MIAVNVQESRCDTLVLIQDLQEVLHIPLNLFSYTQVMELRRRLEQLLSSAGIRVRSARGSEMADAKENNTNEFQQILADLWRRCQPDT